MKQMIEKMKQLGLTEYESKAYLTLLQDYPVNGYTLSKLSGIPRSRIYEVMDGLVKKQIVFEKQVEKATVYTPLEPDLLTKKLKQNFEMVLMDVDHYTNDLFQRDGLDLEPKLLRGRDDVLEMIKVLIGEGQRRIALSVWDEELIAIKQEVDDAIKRGVVIRGVYFGTNNPYSDLVAHRRIERYVAENTERYIIVVIDERHTLYGIISREDNTQVTWSKDPGIIHINDDFIAHDVMLNRYSNMLEGQKRALYERTLDEVRKDYHCFSDEVFELFPLPKDH